jgi:hypothetical protein
VSAIQSPAKSTLASFLPIGTQHSESFAPDLSQQKARLVNSNYSNQSHDNNYSGDKQSNGNSRLTPISKTILLRLNPHNETYYQ